MDTYHCDNCNEDFELKPGPTYLVICPFCKRYIGSISDYGFGPIAPCSVRVGVEELGQIIQKDGYTFVSTKYGIDHRLKGGYKDLECFKECAEYVEGWLSFHMIAHMKIKEINKARKGGVQIDE